jgi:hypothetical protein
MFLECKTIGSCILNCNNLDIFKQLVKWKKKKTITSVRKKHAQNNLQEKSNKFTWNNANKKALKKKNIKILHCLNKAMYCLGGDT